MPSDEHIYTQSSIKQLLNTQSGAGLPRTALFADIDNTLYHETTRLALQAAVQLLRQENWPLITVTGMTAESVLQRVAGEIIPAPDAVMAELGSVLMIKQQNGKYERDEQYNKFIAPLLKPQQQLLLQFAEIPAAIKQQFNLVLQDELAAQALNGKLVSKLGLFASTIQSPENIPSALHGSFPGASIIVSQHIPGVAEELVAGKYCVDVAYVSKLSSVNYLIDKLNIQFGIAAGDSGNDADMLFNSKVRCGIIVGGAEKQVKQFILSNGIATAPNMFEYGNRTYYLSPDTDLAAQGLFRGLSAATALVKQTQKDKQWTQLTGCGTVGLSGHLTGTTTCFSCPRQAVWPRMTAIITPQCGILFLHICYIGKTAGWRWARGYLGNGMIWQYGQALLLSAAISIWCIIPGATNSSFGTRGLALPRSRTNHSALGASFLAIPCWPQTKKFIRCQTEHLHWDHLLLSAIHLHFKTRLLNST